MIKFNRSSLLLRQGLKSNPENLDFQKFALCTCSQYPFSLCRVLQRNLVFVTGIPPKLADVEILKKPEYFGRYGKIHKCVLNQQGPVATAYATYVRDEVSVREGVRSSVRVSLIRGEGAAGRVEQGKMSP